MGELTPCCGPHIVVGVIVRPSIRLDGIWVVLSHTGGDVAMPWCGLVCQQGADRGDALPYVRTVRRAAILLVLGGGVRVRASSGQAYYGPVRFAKKTSQNTVSADLL